MSRIHAHFRRFARRTDGQALVEFALITPFLLVFLVGIIEFGRAWNAHQIITDAAREGARKAAIFDPSVTQADIEAVIDNALASGGLNPDSATVTLTTWDGAQDVPAVVRVEWPYYFLFFGELKKWTTGERRLVLASEFAMRNE